MFYFETVKVRNFAPLVDIDEESATGTSNCALACLLKRKIEALQGDIMEEPSTIIADCNGPRVGGKVVTVRSDALEKYLNPDNKKSKVSRVLYKI